MSKEQIAAAANTRRTATVTLNQPIVRGETSIGSVILTEPRGGALRGLSLGKLISTSEYDEFVKLIPRISNPQITAADFDTGNIAASDIMSLIAESVLFFVAEEKREEIETMQ